MDWQYNTQKVLIKFKLSINATDTILLITTRLAGRSHDQLVTFHRRINGKMFAVL